MKKSSLSLKEFGFISKLKYKEEGSKENIFLPEPEFESIKEFVLKNREIDDSGCEYLRIGHRKRYGEILTAKNYVGIIETKRHTIEILPKIYKVNDEDEIRTIFLKMLRSLKKTPFRQFNTAALKNEKLHLFEIFVRMFLEELGNLVRSGIKSQYVPNEENLNVVKGKIKWSEHLKRNLVHKERVFVEYDEYCVNRPENRIIKTTVDVLLKKNLSNDTSRLLRQYKFIFDEVPQSLNVEKDFILCKNNRIVKDYLYLLPWCRVFLKNESFSTVSGKNEVYSLLFPMEKVFESYVAQQFKRNAGEKYAVSTQDRSKYLFSDPEKMNMKPDIVLRNGMETIVLDTKWKVIDIDSEKSKKGISSSDLYQMYAYGKKYNAKKLILIFPENENFNEKQTYKYDDEMILHIFPWNLSKENVGKISKLF